MAEKGVCKQNARQSSRHKGKYGSYQTRSTCSQCRIIFKSPKHRLVHIESNHKTLTGQSTSRAVKTYESIFDKK